MCSALLALSGCGSSHTDGTEADPAKAVPAAAPLFLGVTVRPTGAEQTGATAAGKELTGRAEPFSGLVSLLETPGSAQLDYKNDIAPWLGPHAGLFTGSLASAESLLGPLTKALTGGARLSVPLGSLHGAIVMDTSDASAARSFLAGQAKRAGAHATSYRGVSYEVGSGVAFGLVGRYAVIGTEEGLRAVIGVTQGEPALSAAGGYSKLTAAAPEAIGHLYVNPTAAAQGAPAGGSGVVALLGGGRQANVSLVASAGSVSLYIDSLARAGRPSASGGLLTPDPEAAQALDELPGDSWLALGLGHAGANLTADVAGLNALAGLLGGEAGSSPTLSLGSLLKGLAQPLSILGARSAAARRDYAAWMSSAGVFASGSSVLELKAAVVISSKDPARSRAAVAKLGAALSRAGDEVTHASDHRHRSGGRRAAAGRAAAAGRRSRVGTVRREVRARPRRSLRAGRAGAHGNAGERSLPLAPPRRRSAKGSSRACSRTSRRCSRLLESVGLSEDPSLSRVLPYLRATTTLAGGGHSLGGEVERFKLVLGLKQSGG